MFFNSLATFASNWGYFTPGISRVMEHTATKFQRLMVPIPVSRHVHIRQKSKMAVVKMKYAWLYMAEGR